MSGKTGQQWNEINEFALNSNAETINYLEGSTQTVNLFTEKPWTISSNQEWLTVSPKTGNGSSILTFTAKANPTGAPRKAVVTVAVSGSGLNQTIILTQLGLVTAINETKEMDIMIFPNPFTDSFCIFGLKGLATLNLFDLNGRFLLNKQVGENEYVSLGELSKGVYIARLITPEGTIQLKLIKK